ncbi:hypothetical protein CIW52_04965 [Mycolicibacterium sp. P9-64]|uniref:DUF7373 family lipoprotein n=1 Tax=Mycolicibacterium sp. P9-64 TaxID=2024612 RepID=UPI0011ED6DDF|nr:hypothetical protein [Mycolicibacterium sp. P9-64]KAA0085299.1 hypothetical protein CIW52_04965 [Mycolicibacterium sp. P9-64]
MRRSVQFGVLVASALVVAACGNDTRSADPAPSTTAPTTSPPPAVVDPKLLDVGTYPTVPYPPLGVAGSPEAGVIADAKQMANFVVGPWAIDERLIDPYLDSFYLIDTATALMGLGPETVAVAAGKRGLINGFASERQETDKTALVNAVLRFSDPGAAAAAAADMGDASAKFAIAGSTPTVVAIPGHPDAVASTYPFTPHGSDKTRATIRSFTPHGPYVLMQFVQAVDGVDAAAALVAKAIDAQGPSIDQFKAAAPEALAAVPLDPTGLLAKTLPTTSAARAKNAVYDIRGAAHFQTDPIASTKLFKENGVSEVAMAKTNVYQAKNAAGAIAITDSFGMEVTSEGTAAAAPIPQLPHSHCMGFPKGFYCVAPAGEYAIEARGEQLLDVQQQISAQYVILTAH